ncbi:hypothetical protein SDC9_129129 [bioreactor metagenome]|uniref:Uncharacterized protein n=1 Tax=bioreactor metagenome TaxID=1076179 RepID=A0A645CYW2_9ZZZZ
MPKPLFPNFPIDLSVDPFQGMDDLDWTDRILVYGVLGKRPGHPFEIPMLNTAPQQP